MKKLCVTIEGKTYDVLVETIEDAGAAPSAAHTQATPLPPLPAAAALQAVAAPQPAVAKTTSGAPGDVPCPLNGKIVSIDVKVGDAVKEGVQVATVEAMKMNTYIYAPCTGNVVAVMVSPGDGVEEGAVLLRIG